MSSENTRGSFEVTADVKASLVELHSTCLEVVSARPSLVFDEMSFLLITRQRA